VSAAQTPNEAGLRIVGLVCGFPGDRAWRRQLLTLKEYKAHVDGSGTGSPDLLVLAGYIAPAQAWIEFSKDWQTRLNHAKLACFKMNEMAHSIEIAGWFYRAIEESKITAAISCAIKTSELVNVVKTFPWPPEITNVKSIKNPYYFAFKAITDMVAQYQTQLGIDEPVDFIFDDESEKVKLSGIWDMIKLSSSPEFRKNMGDEPAFKKDDKVLPLQAADLYAWWIRKWYNDRVVDWDKTLPFPWGMKRNIRRIHCEFGEKDFLVEFEKALRPEARARWNIADPVAALRELERRESGLKTFHDP
jgi:hypothetical protein